MTDRKKRSILLNPYLGFISAFIIIVGLQFFLFNQEKKSLIQEKKIVIVAPAQYRDDYVAGVTIAINEINASGGVLGQSIKTQFLDEHLTSEELQNDSILPQMMIAARAIGEDDDVIAIVGEGRSYQILPAAVILNGYSKLMISTGSTSSALTSIGLNYLFSILPDNDDISIVLSRYAYERGLKRFVVFSDGTHPSQELLIRLRKELTSNNAEILFESESSIGGVDQLDRSILFLLDNSIFKPSDIDAIFLIAKWPLSYGIIIEHLRKLGLKQPIIGPPNLQARELENKLGPELMNNIFTVSNFSQDKIDIDSNHFAKEFYNKYKRHPYFDSFLGYTAIKLVAHAINTTKSFDSAGLANFLRSMRFNQQLMGNSARIAFDNKGLITDEEIDVIAHNGEMFKSVATYKKPFEWYADDDISSVSIIKSLIAGDNTNIGNKKRRLRGN